MNKYLTRHIGEAHEIVGAVPSRADTVDSDGDDEDDDDSDDGERVRTQKRPIGAEWDDDESGAPSSSTSTPKKKAKKSGKSSSTSSGGTGGGFMKPVGLSATLQELIPHAELPRTQVTKHMWEYIKEHQLQDPADRRMILLDDRLKKLFIDESGAPMERISCFAMQKFLKPHLHPLP